MDTRAIIEAINASYDGNFGPLSDLLVAALGKRLISYKEFIACLAYVRANPVCLRRAAPGHWGCPLEVVWGERDQSPEQLAIWEHLYRTYLDKQPLEPA